MNETQIYLISPLETGGDFPDRLARALDAIDDSAGERADVSSAMTANFSIVTNSA